MSKQKSKISKSVFKILGLVNTHKAYTTGPMDRIITPCGLDVYILAAIPVNEKCTCRICRRAK